MNSNDLFVFTMLACCSVFCGIVAYACTGRDLRGGKRLSVALISAFLVGLSFLFVLYLAVLAFLGTVVAYLILRLLVGPRRALAAAAVLFFCGLVCAVLFMIAALSQM